MAEKIMVHTCHNPEKEEYPGICGCNYWIGREQAESQVHEGEAKWMLRRAQNGCVYADYKHIVKIGRWATVPVAKTISDKHIERAYIEGQLNQQRRIEYFDVLTQASFVEIGAFIRERAF